MKATTWSLAIMNCLLSLFIAVVMVDAIWTLHGGLATLGLLLGIPAVQVFNVFACTRLERMAATNHYTADNFLDRMRASR